MVITMQKCIALAAEHIESINYTYPENPSDKSLTYYKGGQKQTIDTKFFDREVRYMVAGSSMSFDKNVDLQVIMATMKTWKGSDWPRTRWRWSRRW